MVLDFHQYSHSKVNFYWNVMYSRGRKGIHVGELLLLNIAACCCEWRDSVLFYLHASLVEKTLNIALMFKQMLSFTVLLPKQQFRVTHTKLLPFILL